MLLYERDIMENEIVCEKINIAICDDEKIIVTHLRKLVTEMLADYGKSSKIECFLTGKSFLESSTKYDLVFMDIELENENGLEVLREYRKDYDAIFIILTSHAEEMPKGYLIRAFRFLVKPINIELLKEAIFSALDTMKNTLRFPAVDEKGNTILVKAKDIIYFGAGDRKSGIKTQKGFYIIYKPLKEIFPLLDTQFYFVHRSYIINMNYIDKINGLIVYMMDDSLIKISRLKKSDFYEKFYSFIRRKSWYDDSI